MPNPPLTITFLGTGTSGGVPMVGCPCTVCSSTHPKDKRLRSSIMVRSATTTLVVDATPDFRQQMLRQNVRQLDALLLTHAHKDHVGGLDDTRGFQYFQNEPTPIYANQPTLEGVKRELPYAFDGTDYPGIPHFDLKEITLAPFTIGDIYIIPIEVWHHHMVVYGYRFGPFTYITDANKIEEKEIKKIAGSQAMVLNALRKEPHISHFTLAQAIALANGIGPKQCFFTHISHQLGLHQQVQAELPKGMYLAYDGLGIKVAAT